MAEKKFRFIGNVFEFCCGVATKLSIDSLTLDNPTARQQLQTINANFQKQYAFMINFSNTANAKFSLEQQEVLRLNK
jgi:hypothetical protein